MRKKPKRVRRSGPGQPPHQPTDETRALVRAASAADRTPDQIASFMKLSKPTLYKHYREELQDGLTGILIKAVLAVNTALNNNSLEFLAQRAQIALTVLLRKGGWSETINLKGKMVHEHHERTQSALARLGEMTKAGQHVSAAQLYQELLNSAANSKLN